MKSVQSKVSSQIERDLVSEIDSFLEKKYVDGQAIYFKVMDFIWENLEEKIEFGVYGLIFNEVQERV